MTYTLGVPQDGQTLGNSKPQVRNNFNDIFNSFATNHIDFNTMGTGWHSLLTMSTLSVNPSLLGAGNVNIFSKLFTGNTLPQLFLAQSSTSTIYQLTGTANAATSTPSPVANGFTWLPGGLLFQWGTFNDSANPLTTNFNVAFPANVFNIQLSFTNTNQFSVVTSTTLTNFVTATKGAQNKPVYWIAIGN